MHPRSSPLHVESWEEGRSIHASYTLGMDLRPVWDIGKLLHLILRQKQIGVVPMIVALDHHN